MLVSKKAREKEYEKLLSDLDNQVWKDMSEERQIYLTRCAQQCDLSSRQIRGIKLWKSREGPAAQSAGSCDECTWE